MKKECVFCGNKPQEKTNEHIIPRWLIALTGDPNREIMIGFKKNGPVELRSFAFNSFKFPACNNCNKMFSELENNAKIIIEKILELESLSIVEINILLDWFDKIRIGLWLAYYNLDKNIANITPNFRIADRIRKFDRMLKIAKYNSNDKRINWGGCETAIFYYIPSCFYLVINDFFFLNISYDFLFSKRLGFPFPEKRYVTGQGNFQETHLSEGLERIHLPIFRKPFKFKGTEFYQPIWRTLVSDERSHTFYGTDYVKNNSLNPDEGIGSVFYSHSQYQGLEKYPFEPTKKWIPNKIYNRDELVKIVGKEVLEWQIYIQELYPSLDLLSNEQRKDRKKFLKKGVLSNKKFIKLIDQNRV